MLGFLRIRISLVVAAGCAVTIAGCSDEQPLPTERPSLSAAPQARALPRRVRPEEADFAEIARSAGSAAGVYIDSAGRMVVQVRDTGDFPAARAAVARLKAAKRIRVSRRGRKIDPAIVVRKADYSYEQLATARDAIFDSLFVTTEGVVSLDLDERQNRVVLGVQAERLAALREPLLARVAGMGIDTAAVRLVAHQPGREAQSGGLPAPCFSLNHDFCRPLVGGLQIHIEGKGYCTIGVVANHGTSKKFISASHCTRTKFGTDGDIIAQASYSADGSKRIGYEEYDNGGYACGILMGRCRGSDAALFAFNAGLLPSAEVGLIARPTQHRTYAPATTQIDASRPYFIITEAAYSYQGQEVDKVGIRTGWTWGFVQETCVDKKFTTEGHEEGNYTTTTCMDRANYWVDEGDSGGPVFEWDGGDYVRFLGIVGTSDGYYSRFSRINDDLSLGTPLLIARGYRLTTPQVTASVVNGNPSLSWPVVAGAQRYHVFSTVTQRECDEFGCQWVQGGLEDLGTTTSPSFVHTGVVVQAYAGTTQSQFYSQRVYWVRAESNSDLSLNSQQHYFRP